MFDKVNSMKAVLMRRWLGWFIASGMGIALLVCSAQPAQGQIIEAGLGVVVARDGGPPLGSVILVPRAALGLGLLGVGLDLWVSPGTQGFILLPFLEAQIPLILLKIYGGVAPIFSGGPQGLSLLSPLSEIAVKAGVRVAPPLSLIGAYGELVMRISPLQQSISSAALVLGLSLGF
jgi:hypothetical protein